MLTLNKYLINLSVILTISFSSNNAVAQTDKSEDDKKSSLNLPAKTSNWADKVSIRGYMQTRYNRLLETNGQLKCEQCDKSWGKDGGFFIRRMRIIFYGQLSKQVYFTGYNKQPEFEKFMNRKIKKNIVSKDIILKS